MPIPEGLVLLNATEMLKLPTHIQYICRSKPDGINECRWESDVVTVSEEFLAEQQADAHREATREEMMGIDGKACGSQIHLITVRYYRAG